MRRIAQALVLAGALLGLGLTALPATASPVTASTDSRAQASHAGSAAQRLTPAQLRALHRAEVVNSATVKHGIIAGFVLGPNGKPEEGICVKAFGPHGSRTAFSEANGAFVIAGVPLGDYRVEYRGCSPIASVVGQWYGGLTRASAAKVMVAGTRPVQLAPVKLGDVSPKYTQRPLVMHQSKYQRMAAQFRKIRAAKPESGAVSSRKDNAAHVTGVVTNKAGHPLAGICVDAIPVNAGGLYPFFGAVTGKSGHYSMAIRFADRYRIDFLPMCGQVRNYAPQLWKDAESVAASIVLRVHLRERFTQVSAVLAAGARISGKVKAAGGATASLGGLCVAAQGTGGQRLFEGETRTRSNGTFVLTGVATGKYRISVFSGCGKASAYLPATLHKLVSVTDGKTTKGLTIAVRLGGTITGTVTDSSSKPLAGICAFAVRVYSANGGGFEVGYGASTGKNGTYKIVGLAAHSYQMQFNTGCGSNGPYAPVTLPKSVPVALGKTTAGVDAVMPLDGSISGVVKNANGKPLGGVCVATASTAGAYLFAKTAADGTYHVRKAPPGNYEVEFVPDGFGLNCGQKGNYVPALATTIVNSGAVSTVNETLPTGGVITGTVENDHGKPLSGICAESGGISPEPMLHITKSNGRYRLERLVSGTYQVAFFGGCGNKGSFAPQAYRGDPTFFGLRNISVTQGKVSSGITAEMRPGATIRGRVTDQSGKPVNNVCVLILGATGAGGDADFGAQVVTHHHGVYSAGNLPPGQYSVLFSGRFKHHNCSKSTYADQEFKSQTTGGDDTISAGAGTVTAGVDATLLPAGQISGVVTRKSTGRGAFVCVTATDPKTKATETTGTGSHGKYTVPDLPPGQYKVEFTNCNNAGFIFEGAPNLANQWYKDKPTSAGATLVKVTGGHTTPGIDGAMTPGGGMTGRVVYRPNGRPVSTVCVLAFTPNFSTGGLGITNRRGLYSITGLSTGRYIVEFEPCSYESALASQAKASTLSVVAGRVVHHVDESLVVGGTVSGVVRYRGAGKAKGAPGTCVEFLPLSPTGVGFAVISGPGGKYDLPGLAPGTYQVVYADPLCSSDEPALSVRQTQRTSVASQHTTTGVNATLRVTGAISGGVSSAGGGRIAGICAQAFRASGSSAAVVGVTKSGGYSISDLQPGRYKVEFTTGCGASGYAKRWFGDAASRRNAKVVVVKADKVSKGIDATLKRG